MSDTVIATFDPPNVVVINQVIETVEYNGQVVVVTPPSTAVDVIMVATQGPPGAGASAAAEVSYDDVLTSLGVTNVQDAIVALFNLIGGGPPAGSAFVKYAGDQVLYGSDRVIQEIP